MIDAAKAKERAFPPLQVEVERGRLRAFARAIGETDEVYLEVEAAKAAGHRDLPVPPTFLFSLELEAPEPFAYLDDLGVDLRYVLHGEQLFDYHAPAYAGDTLTLQPRIIDVYAKRGGALEFVVKQTDVTRDGEVIAQTTSTLVVRHPEVA